MVLWSKEDLRKLFPPDIDSKLRYEEDPENSVIHIIWKKYLGWSGSQRFLDIVSQIRGVKVIRRGKGWLVPYEPPSEQKAKNFELSGRYEEAAQIYEVLGLYEKAGEARRMERTHYVISTKFELGKDGVIRIDCPHCNASQPAEAKSSEVTCKYCGRKYIVPKKILDMV